MATLEQSIQGQTNYQQLWSFSNPNGQSPYSTLVEGTDGNLYGTASSGGTSNAGLVFSLTRDGTGYRVLHNFAGPPDGQGPVGLLKGSDGILYGTTEFGGTNSNGTVFKISSDGSVYGVIHHFAGGPQDGRLPFDGVVEGRNGALFGTTFDGGSNYSGTVFQLNKDGSGYALLKSFDGLYGGANPVTGLGRGNDGVFYGTTYYGGSRGAGIVYRLSEDGSGYAVIHTFNEVPGDGYYPTAYPMRGSDGFLYGTTLSGGTNDGGAVFKMSTNGLVYSVLYRFLGKNYGDGAAPRGGLVELPNGAIYGTTEYGGSLDLGTVFTLKEDGSAYNVVWRFWYYYWDFDGAGPVAGLLQSSDGSLYGTTYSGGAPNLGTIFKLSAYISQPAMSSISLLGGTSHVAVTRGAAGRSYSILASSSPGLSNAWQSMGTGIAGIRGSFEFLDITASNYPARFYRARWP